MSAMKPEPLASMLECRLAGIAADAARLTRTLEAMSDCSLETLSSEMDEHFVGIHAVFAEVARLTSQTSDGGLARAQALTLSRRFEQHVDGLRRAFEDLERRIVEAGGRV